MSDQEDIRDAREADITSVNEVIAAAIDTWTLPARVKRLALPVYRYTSEDLGHLTLRVLEQDAGVIAVAAWEPADLRDLPHPGSGILLHGMYVHPAYHRRGLATKLLADGARTARAGRHDGILVRAQSGAEGFFTRRGFKRLPVRDEARDYAGRLWSPLS